MKPLCVALKKTPGRPVRLLSVRPLRAWACVLPLLLGAQAHGQQDGAGALAAQYQAMRPQLAASALGVPVVIGSFAQQEELRGEVYAVLAQPFASLRTSLVLPSQWCQMFLLHLNISGCTSAQAGGADWITFYSGGKANALLDKTYPLRFGFQVRDASPAYLETQLRADTGPFGTSDYRISLSAIPVAQGSFIRFSYSFRSSVASRLATNVYLATAGRDKIGFTVQGQASDGSPRYIGGTRAIAERNAVRYYFALQAHMEALAAPPAQQFQRAAGRWFDLTQRYPAQLHEIERPDYLDAKMREYQEQARLQRTLDASSAAADRKPLP
jgi:hypothetical protein